MGVGFVNGFLKFLQRATTIYCSPMANARTLQINTVRTKPSQSAVSSRVVALVTGPISNITLRSLTEHTQTKRCEEQVCESLVHDNISEEIVTSRDER
jgi:hypothetical protein